MNCTLYDKFRLSIKLFLEQIVRKIVMLLDMHGRKTVTTFDVSTILPKKMDQD